MTENPGIIQDTMSKIFDFMIDEQNKTINNHIVNMINQNPEVDIFIFDGQTYHCVTNYKESNKGPILLITHKTEGDFILNTESTKKEKATKTLDSFGKYAENKKKIAELEAENRELQLSIIEDLQNRNLNEYKTAQGKFYFGARKTWTYPEHVNILEGKLKSLKETPEILDLEQKVSFLKKEAEKNGSAKAEVVQHLVFKGI